jgi:hypothetical protein
MDSNLEIPWLQFSQMPQIKRLPLREQIQRYNMLIEEVCAMKMYHSMKDCGGGSTTKRIVSEEFLQQEDLFYVLQENGSKIYITLEKEV